MKPIDDHFEQTLTAYSAARRRALHVSYSCHRTDPRAALVAARRLAATNSAPSQSPSFWQRSLATVNFLDLLFPRLPIWSTAVAVLVLALAIVAGKWVVLRTQPDVILLSGLSGSRALPSVHPVLQPARDASPLLTVPSHDALPTNAAIELNEWTFPASLELNLKGRKVRFFDDKANLVGSLEPLAKQAPQIDSFNFTVSGRMTSKDNVLVRGTLVLTRRETSPSIRSRADIQSVRAFGAMEILVRRTNSVERSFAP